ncbi:MAG TPA: FtsX-like permease family protein, partial [Gemmatimonadales bacterium]|nr:FtsX-like permease family protein [Gemmatimonadales bacterium]
CANIANLLLARAVVRSKEVAIRAALGAQRVHLLRQLLTKSLLLSLAGAVPGVLLARLGLWTFMALNPALPRATEISIDAQALAFALVTAVATGILFGIGPALQGSRVDLADVLRDGSGGGTAGPPAGRLLGALVVVEVALALTLVVGTGLMIKSMARLQSVDPGFDAGHALAFRLSLPTLKYPTDTEQAPPDGDVRIVSPGYLAALGAPIVRGRAFDDQDIGGRPRVAVIDAVFAKERFSGADPIGRRIALDPQPGATDSAWATVVGVVAHTAHEGLDATPRTQSYFPVAQVPFAKVPLRSFGVAVRSDGDPMALLASVHEQIRDLDPELPPAAVSTLAAMMDMALGPRRLATVLLGTFAALAILLASIGIYGLLSHSVEQRARELSIRAALGGTRTRLLALVMRRGLTLVATGLAAGTMAGFALTRLLSSQLYGVTPTDPVTFLIGTLVLAAVAGAATVVPAIRATGADPLVALR